MAAKEKPQRPKAAAKPAADQTPAPQGERIAKVLSRAGISSRREAERLIEAGEVTVNGKVVTSPALNVVASDRITVSGQPVGAPEPPRLWLYYKPEGLVTSASDEKGRDTVFDALPEDMPRVMSVGRLDLNSEGLLLLTNDGALKRQLELPSTGWLRKYRVRVKGNPTDPDLEPLRRGIIIEGERFQPMEVKLDRHQGANAWLTVGLREGKNREIRRAMFAINLTVNRLIRVSYGPFRLNEMQPGEVEEVKSRVLRDQLGSLMAGIVDDGETPAKRPARGPRLTVRTTSRKGDPGEASDRPATKAAPVRSGGLRNRDQDDLPEQGPRKRAASTRTASNRADAQQTDPKQKGTTRTGMKGTGTRRTASPTSGPTEVKKTRPATARTAAERPAAGTVSSARGRKALGQLSDAWADATAPARRSAKPKTAPASRSARDEGETASKPRPRAKTTAAKPATRNASPRDAGPAKPGPRRK